MCQQNQCVCKAGFCLSEPRTVWVRTWFVPHPVFNFRVCESANLQTSAFIALGGNASSEASTLEVTTPRLRPSTRTERQESNTSLTTQTAASSAALKFNDTSTDNDGHEENASASSEQLSHASSPSSGTDSSGNVLLESAIWHHVCNACSWIFGSCSNVGCQHVDWNNYAKCSSGQYLGQFGGTVASMKDNCANKCLDYIQNHGSTSGCCDLSLAYYGSASIEQGTCRVSGGSPVQYPHYAKQFAARINTR